MKHVVLPYSAEQALSLIEQLQVHIDVLHNAYQLDFIDMAASQHSSQTKQEAQFDDPLDF